MHEVFFFLRSMTESKLKAYGKVAVSLSMHVSNKTGVMSIGRSKQRDFATEVACPVFVFCETNQVREILFLSFFYLLFFGLLKNKNLNRN